MNNKNQILNELYAALHGTMTHNTDRIKTLAAELNNPQNAFPTVHVAGTNGKGSVCALLASILQESGMKTGLYSSPHIIEFNERIRINGEKISDNDIKKYYNRIKKLATEINASFFDMTTAMAFDYFANNKIDFAIIETGLGGRLDATNIITPKATVITTIDKDHCDLLGNSIEEIAAEKAGIMKSNVPWILQESNDNVKNIFMKKAAELNAPQVKCEACVEMLGIDSGLNMSIKIGWPRNIKPQSSNKYQLVETKLCGEHQIQNIETAIKTAAFLAQYYPNITAKTIAYGIKNVVKNTKLRFRIECIAKNPTVIVDISHNPQSIAALCNTIKMSKIAEKWNVIFGVMKDKNIEQMLMYLRPICNKLTIVEAEIDRAAKAEEVVQIAKRLGFGSVEAGSIDSALDSITANTIVCGSFYIMNSPKLMLND